MREQSSPVQLGRKCFCCLDQKMNTQAGWTPLEQKEDSSQKTVRCQRQFFILYQEFGHYDITRLAGFLLVALN